MSEALTPAYIVTYRCPLQHERRVAYAYELGRSWVESQAVRAAGTPGGYISAPLSGRVRVPHKPGEERCGTCGDDRLTYTLEARFE
jgi:hypothetical protein